MVNNYVHNAANITAGGLANWQVRTKLKSYPVWKCGRSLRFSLT